MATENPPAQARALGARTILIVAAAAIIVSISMGLRQSIGLFLAPLQADLGVTASTFGFALALQSLAWGLTQPFVGILADKFGARPVVFAGAAIYGLGFLLTASAPPAVGLTLGVGLMTGLGVSGTAIGILVGAVARIVPAHARVQIVGVVTAVGSLATLVIAPLGQHLIASQDWRMAMMVFMAIAFSMALFGVLLGKKPPEPEQEEEHARMSLKDMVKTAMSHPGFLAMTIAFFACGFQLMYITVHLPNFLAICGIAPGVSATALGLIGLGNGIGALLMGQLGARLSQKKLLATLYLLRTIAIICFLSLPVTPASTYVFAAAMGMLWLSVVPLVSGLIGRLFGLQYFSMLYGFAFLSHQAGSFLGSWMGGLSYDLTGAYDVAWGSLIVVGFSAFLLQWFMDDKPRPHAGARAAAAAAE